MLIFHFIRKSLWNSTDDELWRYKFHFSGAADEKEKQSVTFSI